MRWSSRQLILGRSNRGFEFPKNRNTMEILAHQPNLLKATNVFFRFLKSSDFLRTMDSREIDYQVLAKETPK